jgi:hypothetical protein
LRGCGLSPQGTRPRLPRRRAWKGTSPSLQRRLVCWMGVSVRRGGRGSERPRVAHVPRRGGGAACTPRRFGSAWRAQASSARSQEQSTHLKQNTCLNQRPHLYAPVGPYADLAERAAHRGAGAERNVLCGEHARVEMQQSHASRRRELAQKRSLVRRKSR